MQPVSAPGSASPGERPLGAASSTASPDQPLTPAQRATLENLVVKVQSLTSLKTDEVWSALRQDIGVKPEETLLSRHYQPAEQALQTRLAPAQSGAQRLALLQQLADLLPQGDNRQRVSEFIQRQFGHTELSALSQPQLQRVLAQVQSASTPANAPTAERPLTAGEQYALNQNVSRLAALTGESPGKIWSTLLALQNLTPGAPVPARHQGLLTQFLQTQTSLHLLLTGANNAQPTPAMTAAASTPAGTPPTLSPAAPAPGATSAASDPRQTAAPSSSHSPTLSALQTIIQPQLATHEEQLLQDYAQQRFNAGMQTPLTPTQAGEVVVFLFTHRLQRAQNMAGAETMPPPIANPLIAALPPSWQAVFQRPMFWRIASVCVVLFLLWVVM